MKPSEIVTGIIHRAIEAHDAGDASGAALLLAALGLDVRSCDDGGVHVEVAEEAATVYRAAIKVLRARGRRHQRGRFGPARMLGWRRGDGVVPGVE